MKKLGFTIVEIVITITIMGILLTLVVINLNGSQTNARDTERKGDVEAIAAHFETYYKLGSPSGGGGSTYPGTQNISESSLKNLVPDLDPKSLRAPDISDSSPISLVPATNATQTAGGVAPQPTLTTYVYQPVTSQGTLCTDPALITPNTCRKFNIYYLQESDQTVQVMGSKHQ